MITLTSPVSPSLTEPVAVAIAAGIERVCHEGIVLAKVLKLERLVLAQKLVRHRPFERLCWGGEEGGRNTLCPRRG